MLLPALPSTRSGLPSPLKSPTATDCGNRPAAKGLPGAGWNPPVPSPRRTVKSLELLLAVTISGLPSPLKSATATDCGPVPTANGLPAAGVNPPVPSPKRIVTVLSPKLAVTRSRLPSLLKSPTATDCGFAPTAKGLPAAAVNPPIPSPRRSVTLLPVLAVTRSGIPSPLKSPTATEAGVAPSANGLPAAAWSPPDGFATLNVTVVAASK